MGKKSSKSTVGPSKFAQPYISNAANSVRDAFTANAPNAANLSSTLNDALPGIASNTLNNPGVGAASTYDQNVLGGQYLGAGNPNLQQQIDNTNSDVANGVNAAIGTRGGAGGSAQAQILARELAKNETNLRYTDYNNERDRMGTAATNAGALATTQNQGIATLLAALQEGATLPTTNATGLASSIGGLMGNYTTQTKQASTFDNLMSLISAGSSAAKAAFPGGA